MLHGWRRNRTASSTRGEPDAHGIDLSIRTRGGCSPAGLSVPQGTEPVLVRVEPADIDVYAWARQPRDDKPSCTREKGHLHTPPQRLRIRWG